MSLAADAILLQALVVAVGLPLYVMPLTEEVHRLLIVLLVSIGVVMPSVLPLIVWWVRWGQPSRRVVRTLFAYGLAYETPAVIGVAAIIAMESPLMFVSVGIMSFIAAVMSLVSASILGRSCSDRMRLLRAASVIGTPLIVLAYTNTPAYGVFAMQGWSIPIAVIVAGAFGAARGMQFLFMRPMAADAARAA